MYAVMLILTTMYVYMVAQTWLTCDGCADIIDMCNHIREHGCADITDMRNHVREQGCGEHDWQLPTMYASLYYNVEHLTGN